MSNQTRGPAVLQGLRGQLGRDMDSAVVALAGGPTRAAWMVHARCRDQPPAVFFPTDGAGVEIAREIARKIGRDQRT